jgi:hypothetical protein
LKKSDLRSSTQLSISFSRRKKKCIRVQAYIEGKLAENGSGGQNGGSALTGTANGDVGNGTGDKSRHGLNNNRFDNGKRPNGLMHSDCDDDDDDEDDDDDDDDLDDDTSPTSHQGRNSVESTSEQSLTSPAGFSSLPSIGSPAGSVASPSTPGGYENLAGSIPSSAGGMLGGPPDPSFWYSRPSGAFKPPAPAAPPGLYPNHASFQHAQQLQALHAHYQQLQAAGGMLHRPPVGTDPRDSKNPLSISQLTSNHTSSPSLPAAGLGVVGLPAVDGGGELKRPDGAKSGKAFFNDENRAI